MRTLTKFAIGGVIVGSIAATVPTVVMGESPRANTQKAAAAKQYLNDTRALDNASSQFQSVALSWLSNASVTSASAARSVRPLLEALASFQYALLHQSWPSYSKGDIASLASTGVGLAKDLRSLTTIDLRNIKLWEAPLLHDQQVVTAAGNRVRKDFGLPAAP